MSCLLGCRVSEAGFSGPCIWVTGHKTGLTTAGAFPPPRIPVQFLPPPPTLGWAYLETGRR